MINADGTGERRLTWNHADDTHPAWRNGGRDLYRVDVAKGALTRLTRNLEVWAQPSWSPDGRRILFSAKMTGVDEVYVVNADGTDVTRMTRGTGGIR